MVWHYSSDHCYIDLDRHGCWHKMTPAQQKAPPRSKGKPERGPALTRSAGDRRSAGQVIPGLPVALTADMGRDTSYPWVASNQPRPVSGTSPNPRGLEGTGPAGVSNLDVAFVALVAPTLRGKVKARTVLTVGPG